MALFQVAAQANVFKGRTPKFKKASQPRSMGDMVQLSSGAFKLSIDAFKRAEIKENDGIVFGFDQGRVYICVVKSGATSLNGKKGSKDSQSFTSNILEQFLSEQGIHTPTVKTIDATNKEGQPVLDKDGNQLKKDVYPRTAFDLIDVTEEQFAKIAADTEATEEEKSEYLSNMVKIYEIKVKATGETSTDAEETDEVEEEEEAPQPVKDAPLAETSEVEHASVGDVPVDGPSRVENAPSATDDDLFN